MNIDLELYEEKEIENKYTFKNLYEAMLEEIDRYEKLGMLEDLFNSKVTIESLDKKGIVLIANMNFSAGFLEGDIYQIQGQLCSLDY